jgi:hypothetical protein
LASVGQSARGPATTVCGMIHLTPQTWLSQGRLGSPLLQQQRSGSQLPQQRALLSPLILLLLLLLLPTLLLLLPPLLLLLPPLLLLLLPPLLLLLLRLSVAVLARNLAMGELLARFVLSWCATFLSCPLG